MMRYLENRRLKRPLNTIKIENLKYINIPEDYILYRDGSKLNYIIKDDDVDKIIKDERKAYQRKLKTSEEFLLTKAFIKNTNGNIISDKQRVEIERVMYAMWKYNEMLRIETLVLLLNNGIETKLLERIRLLGNLKATDSRFNKILLYGIKKGLEEFRINKSERVKGSNNPAYQHGGKLSPYSKKFIKYDSSDESENIRKSMFDKNIKNRNDNQNNTCRLDYYTSRGRSEEDAVLALKKRQTTFSKQKCIDKYGDVKGFNVWKKRQNKWQGTLTSKSQEEIDIINKKKRSIGGCSKIATELFGSLGYGFARYDGNGGE